MKIRFTLFWVIAGSLFLISSTINLNDLFNYANQPVPNYINKDNTPPNNPITDEGATLGRVLFYDKNLSVNNTIACASCHKQEFAFGDTALASVGVAGVTGRHSMRLVNARFADENDFFWDERANSLETQTTMPIQDHVEMGFSGNNGDPDLDSLIRKLEDIPYYQELSTFVYGDPQVSEQRIQRSIAKFVRSIQSFDSKYDAGRLQVNNNNAPFPNFTQQENTGKTLFSTPPNQGGAGCQACHRAPEFDIRPNSRNNGVIGVLGDPNATDLTVTRAPTLRDMVNPDGQFNGPLMHNGAFNDLLSVINHYDFIPPNPNNTNLDPRLSGGPGGGGQNLQLTQAEKDALVVFLGTLTGTDVYTNEKWSNPFDSLDNLNLIPFCGNGLMTSISADICEGSTLEGYSQAGVYVDTLISMHGCDSIRTLVLSELPVATMTIDASICSGESYEGYETAGIYMDIFQSANGCDSTRMLVLEVMPISEATVETTICAGEQYEGYETTGTYTETFQAVNGCDSIRTLVLEVMSVPTTTIETSICAGTIYEGYETAGTYTDNFQTANGCDSIRMLILEVMIVSVTTIETSICAGTNYEGYETAGTYTDNFQAANGCDSIRTLALEVVPVVATSIEASICENDNYEGYGATGIYTETFQSINGCDSIRTLILEVKSIAKSTVETSICVGESYEGYEATGIYTDLFQAVNGCDSTRTLMLEVLPLSESTVEATICEGENYDGYEVTGVYTEAFQSVNGCDSTRTLLLEVLPTKESIIETIICMGENFEGYEAAGTYMDTLQAANGCDSIRTLLLEVLSTAESTIEATICEGGNYEGYETTGIYTETFQAVNGCDSTRTLNLEVLPVVETSIETSICEGENYEGYETAGTYTDTYQAINGCDSIRTIILEVLPVAESIIDAEICEGEEYEGYITSGTYTDTFTGYNGCDSIRILELTILPADHPDCAINAVGDAFSANAFQVYPNPFQDLLNIACDCDLELTIEVFSLTGQKVISQQTDFHRGNTLLTTHQLMPGIYFVIGTDSNGQQYFSKKLVRP